MSAILAWILAHGTELLSLAQTLALLFHGKTLIASNRSMKDLSQAPAPSELVK